ncbi:hypothetical protein [Kineococcus rhizosphaerae]|uniref:Uncharacterized protein n=1 Tax=Kineococcus rhizosphaerae TaxID=559628 RepID=A0A2T0QWQ9_9ACTN|nr:hypothetical protein [Kineococcus rhizosphaerae]PRY09902.1 hypothetical protein CLV37_11910 [Kineococcus rhizosphaerae]
MTNTSPERRLATRREERRQRAAQRLPRWGHQSAAGGELLYWLLRISLTVCVLALLVAGVTRLISR